MMRSTTAMLLALLTACGCQPKRDERQGTREMTTDSLAIELSVQGKRIRATLVNGTGDAVTILHTARHQACELVLTDGEGHVLQPFDSRSIKKGDDTVYCTQLTEVAPGARQLLFDGEFEEGDGGRRLEWGPFEFAKVASGRYRATVRWAATAESCFDEDSMEEERPAGLWRGTLDSNEVTIDLD